MQHGDSGAGTRCNMRKLHGDEPAAYENDVFRQLLKFHKPGAVDKVRFAWNFQAGRRCSGGNEKVPGLKSLALDFYCTAVNKFGPSMEALDSRLLE